MKTTVHNSKYFYGNEISRYGQQQGYLDYSTLAKAFDAVLCNDVTRLFYSTINGDYMEAEQINGFTDDDEQPDIYQYYIISEQGADIIQEFTNDPLFYIDYLNIYIWGVTHYGTSWDYVLTDVILEV